MAAAVWRDLVEVARWAPSPHNMQPWRVRPRSATDADLLVDPARLLAETDADGAFMTVAVGVFVETLAVAARAGGADVAVELVGDVSPRATERTLFAHLGLVDGAAKDALSPQLVLERRTSRLPYDDRPLGPAVVTELRAVAAAFGHAIEFSSDRALVRWVVDLNRDTLFHDLTDPVARREVGDWLRFSRRSAAARRDGFSPAALGFPGWLLRSYFAAAPAFELPLLRDAVRTLYGRTMRGTRTIGWLSGPWAGRDDWFVAGRMLSRLWLTMTHRGVVLHPFGSVITNVRANALLEHRIRAPQGKLWLVFRAGYSAVPPRSYRLTADEVLLE
jgi:hypothetical protein